MSDWGPLYFILLNYLCAGVNNNIIIIITFLFLCSIVTFQSFRFIWDVKSNELFLYLQYCEDINELRIWNIAATSAAHVL